MATKAKRLATLPDHFSWSSLSLHRDCPGAWCDKYLRGLEEELSDPQIFGSAFHGLSALYDEHCQAEKTGTDPAAIDRIFDAYMVAHPEAIAQSTEIKQLFTEYVHGHTVDYEHQIAVEWPLETRIDEHKLTGILDRIYQEDGELTIRDLKTDGAIRSQADVDRDEQLGIYALLARDHYKWPNPITVEMQFVRYGVIRRSIRDGEAIERVREKIAQEIALITTRYEAWCEGNTDAFPYRVGSRCSICGFASRCLRIRELAAEEGRIIVVTTDDALRVATAMVALDERLKQTKKALKPYCSEHGNLEVNGLVVGFHKTESYRYPTVTVASILQNYDEEPLIYMNVSATAIKRAMRASEELRAAVERVREDASYTRFEARKLKE